MTLIYKINDLESKIPYTQWEALKKEFVEFAKEKRQLEINRDEAIEYIKNNTKYFDSEYVSIYGELCDIAGAGDTRTHCVIGDEQLLEILERGKE